MRRQARLVAGLAGGKDGLEIRLLDDLGVWQAGQGLIAVKLIAPPIKADFLDLSGKYLAVQDDLDATGFQLLGIGSALTRLTRRRGSHLRKGIDSAQ